jgi:hypothetical protein
VLGYQTVPTLTLVLTVNCLVPPCAFVTYFHFIIKQT